MREGSKARADGRVLACVLLALPCACAGQELCSTEAVPAVEVRVRDATDQREVCDATVVLRSNDGFEERPSAQGSPCLYRGAYERPGTYTIDVSKSGYRSAHKDGVTAVQDNCHVMTEQVSMDLSP